MLNLLGIKNAEDISKIKVDTDYITEVEVRLNSLCDSKKEINNNALVDLKFNKCIIIS